MYIPKIKLKGIRAGRGTHAQKNVQNTVKHNPYGSDCSDLAHFRELMIKSIRLSP